MARTAFEACKKRKRTPHFFTASHFSASDSAIMEYFHGSFKDNITEFLKRCAEAEDYSVAANPVWCALLVSESSGVVFPLYVVQENVKSSYSSSSQPLCNLCRFVGWSHHFVSKRNYHLIVPEDYNWSKPLKEESLKLQTHLLHGVIHCNGFGHLLCIKTETNSNYLQGEELMNLWDHLCASLQTRDISVHDLSKKGLMNLRLLHGVAYGHSWFGKWGYKLCRGSFGLTKQDYSRAIEILSSLDLSKIICDFTSKRQGKLIERIIQTYRAVSETYLVTITDLLQFMLAFKSKSLIQRKTALALASVSSKSSAQTTHLSETPMLSHPNNSIASQNPNDHRTLSSFVAKLDARWPARRIEHAVKVIFQILKTHGAAMLRQELRDAIREHIGDTGLIDFVLKHINKVIVGNQIIRRENNPTTKLLEFSLENASGGVAIERKMQLHTDILSLQPGVDVYKDLLFLYKNVLLGYPEHHAVSIASRVILDSKHLVKKWQFKRDNKDNLLRLICQVRPSYDDLVNELTRQLPPGELVVTQKFATVGDLKQMVQCALRDTYFVMDKFVVKDIQMGEWVAKEYQELFECGVKQGMEVWVRGCGLDLDTKLRYQGGDNDWTVDCRCGAEDDDGERMVACDVCHVWQHTRCNSIEDGDAPPWFLCRMCRMKKLDGRCNSCDKSKNAVQQAS